MSSEEEAEEDAAAPAEAGEVAPAPAEAEEVAPAQAEVAQTPKRKRKLKRQKTEEQAEEAAPAEDPIALEDRDTQKQIMKALEALRAWARELRGETLHDWFLCVIGVLYLLVYCHWPEP